MKIAQKDWQTIQANMKPEIRHYLKNLFSDPARIRRDFFLTCYIERDIDFLFFLRDQMPQVWKHFERRVDASKLYFHND